MRGRYFTAWVPQQRLKRARVLSRSQEVHLVSFLLVCVPNLAIVVKMTRVSERSVKTKVCSISVTDLGH